MRAINIITLILTIVGGLNWGLVGLFEFNLVSALLGQDTVAERAVYVIVGLSALWQLAPLAQSFKVGEPAAEAHSRRVH